MRFALEGRFKQDKIYTHINSLLGPQRPHAIASFAAAGRERQRPRVCSLPPPPPPPARRRPPPAVGSRSGSTMARAHSRTLAPPRRRLLGDACVSATQRPRPPPPDPARWWEIGSRARGRRALAHPCPHRRGGAPPATRTTQPPHSTLSPIPSRPRPRRAVALNPYQMLPLYGQDMLEAYNQYGQASPGPHVFGVAAATYRGLLDARSQVRARASARKEGGGCARDVAVDGGAPQVAATSRLPRRLPRRLSHRPRLIVRVPPSLCRAPLTLARSVHHARRASSSRESRARARRRLPSASSNSSPTQPRRAPAPPTRASRSA